MSVFAIHLAVGTFSGGVLFLQFQIALVLAADDLTGICRVSLAPSATVKFSSFRVSQHVTASF